MSRRMFTAGFALACWGLAGSALAAEAGHDPSFNLVNRGRAPLREIYVTPAGDANWGQNRLKGEKVPPGSSFEVRRRADGNCVMDIRVVFADGTREERRGINTCTLDAVAVGSNEGEATLAKTDDDPSFRLVNRGKVPITELFATQSGIAGWGENRLPPGGLPADAATVVRIVRTNQCLYDLRVVFADHKALEKRRADLCRITDLPVP